MRVISKQTAIILRNMLLILTILYFCFAFSSLEINPLAWKEGIRQLFSVVYGSLCFIIIMF